MGAGHHLLQAIASPGLQVQIIHLNSRRYGGKPSRKHLSGESADLLASLLDDHLAKFSARSRREMRPTFFIQFKVLQPGGPCPRDMRKRDRYVQDLAKAPWSQGITETRILRRAHSGYSRLLRPPHSLRRTEACSRLARPNLGPSH